MAITNPLGPGGTWKTGQRVPVSGIYADQYGVVSRHEQHATFPPCISRKGEVAYRHLIEVIRVTA